MGQYSELLFWFGHDLGWTEGDQLFSVFMNDEHHYLREKAP